MRRLEIEPYDVVLFRDARPFGVATASGSASGLFPPPPSVVYGAVRTAAYRAHGAVLRRDGAPEVPEDVAAVWGDASTHGMVHLRGPLPACTAGEVFWPTPATILRQKHGTALVVTTPPARAVFTASSASANLRPAWCPVAGVQVPAGGYLTTTGLSAYLSGSVPPTESHRAEDALVTLEPRNGIALEGSLRTVSTGALFTMGFRRLREAIVIVGWIEGDEGKPLPDEGALRLGQDGKLARFRMRQTSSGDFPPCLRAANPRFLVYLATSALFAQGWLPSWIDPATLTTRRADFRARLVSVAMDRPRVLGGWDLAQRRPRALRRLAPAGAVYFFECDTTNDAEAAIDALHGQCISEEAGDGDAAMPEAAPSMGFGFCMTGVW
jgi:CRISPR-associated protein Cmr3